MATRPVLTYHLDTFPLHQQMGTGLLLAGSWMSDDIACVARPCECIHGMMYG